LASKGVDGLKAYGLLKKLGEAVPPPSDLGSLLAVDDAAIRGNVVEIAANLPVADAVPVLRQASKDGSAAVRQKVVAVVAGWSAADGSGSGLPIVRTLADDSDVGVRSRASLLLTRLLPKQAPEPEEPAEAAAAPTAASPSSAAATLDLGPLPDLAPAVDAHPPSDLGSVAPPPAAGPDLGVAVVAPTAVPAAAAPAAAVAAVPAAAAAEPVDKAGLKLRLKQTQDAAEKLLSRGEYDKAIQVLEDARRSDSSKNLLMQLGQAYELWSEQESGKKQKTLTKKAIDTYKLVKSAAAKEHIAELQQRLQ
jgi:hypothetical protein